MVSQARESPVIYPEYSAPERDFVRWGMPCIHHLPLRGTSCQILLHILRTNHTQPWPPSAFQFFAQQMKAFEQSAGIIATVLTSSRLPSTGLNTDLHDSLGSTVQVFALQAHPKKM